MTAGQWWILVGGVLQVVGVVVTALGALETWNRFRPGERIWNPVVEPLVQARNRAWGAIRRRFGLAKAHHASAKGVAATSLSATATGRKQFRELPQVLDHSEALSELDDRTHELLRKIYDNDDKHGAKTMELEQSINTLRDDVAAKLAQQQEETVEAAAGGVRTILAGLLATGLGVAVVTIGSIPPVAG